MIILGGYLVKMAHWSNQNTLSNAFFFVDEKHPFSFFGGIHNSLIFLCVLII